jgi:hypothetical protein
MTAAVFSFCFFWLGVCVGMVVSQADDGPIQFS